MLLGAARYSQLLFGKAWLKLFDQTPEQHDPAMLGSTLAQELLLAYSPIWLT